MASFGHCREVGGGDAQSFFLNVLNPILLLKVLYSEIKVMSEVLKAHGLYLNSKRESRLVINNDIHKAYSDFSFVYSEV